MRHRVGIVVLVVLGAASARAHARETTPEDRTATRAAAPLPSRDVRYRATAAVALDTGSLPRPALGGALGLDLGRGILSLGFTTSLFAPNTGTAVVPVGLVDLLATLCTLGPIGGGARAGFCAGGGAGVLFAAGPSATRLAVRPSFVVGVRVELPIGRWLAVRVDAGPLFDPLRPSIATDEPRGAYLPALVTQRTALSVDVRFW